MAEIERIRSTARQRFLRVELLRADQKQHAADGVHLPGCAYCLFAEEAIRKLQMDGFKFQRIAKQCDALELAFTERLRATARNLGELDVAKRFAKNCAIKGHKCQDKRCGCKCHPWGRIDTKLLQFRSKE